MSATVIIYECSEMRRFKIMSIIQQYYEEMHLMLLNATLNTLLSLLTYLLTYLLIRRDSNYIHNKYKHKYKCAISSSSAYTNNDQRRIT